MTRAKEASPQEILHMIKNLRRPEYLGENSFSWLIARIEQLEKACELLMRPTNTPMDIELIRMGIETGPKPGTQICSS